MADLIYQAPDNGFYGSLSTGNGFTTSTSWASPYPGNFQPQQGQHPDLNGDGKADLIYQDNVGSTSEFNVQFSSSPAPDLLTSMSNGYGGSATIAYLPSTQYSNTQLPYPVQTVKTITTDDGNGNIATSTYEFAGGYHHFGDREFRGFNYAKVTGPLGPSGEQAIEETWFHQGNDTAVDVNDPSVADGYLKGAVYKKRVTDGASNLFTETRTTYTPDDNGLAPFYTPPAQIVTDICNGNACTAQTQTDFTYDIYGNVTQEVQRKDVAETTDDLTTVRTFSPNTTDWILGLPTSEINYAGIGTTGTQLTRTDFYYDGTTSCNIASTNQTPTKGLLTRSVKWLSASADPETRIAYDDLGNPVCSRNANGNTTSMTYDSEGFFEITFTDSLGYVTTTQYYGVGGIPADNGIYGQVKQITDPNGATVSTAYDALGRILSVTQPDGFVTTTSYNNFGTIGTQHVRSDSPLGLSTWSYFDGMGRTTLTKSTGADSKIIVSKTEYDVRGAVKRSSTPYFEVGGSPLWSTVTYDAVGRVLQTVNPDGSRTLTCYDDWVQVSINANDQKKRVVQDADGRAIAVQEYQGTFTTCDTAVGVTYSTTLYQYDILGNLRFVTDTLGNQSEMRYDELSRKVFMHDPDMGDWTYAYDTVGNLTLQTDAKAQQIHFQYDALNRQVQKDFGTQKTLGTGDMVYTFDGVTSNGIGRLTNVADSSGTSTFYYDIAGRGIRTDKVISGTTYTTQSAYDGLGRVTTLTYPDTSAVTHTYNGPQLQSVQEGTTTYVSYAGFNALGQPATVTSGNGVVTTYAYDLLNFRLKTLKTVNASITLQDLGYTFDAGGNVTAITNPIHGNQAFTYDDLNRLTNATGMTASPSTFSYDQIGNMLSNSRIGTYNYAPGAQTAWIPDSGSSAFAGANHLERFKGVQTASLPISESKPYALWAPDDKVNVSDYYEWTLVRTSSLLATVPVVTHAAITSATTTLDIRVSASSDDAVQRVSGGRMYLTSSDLLLTYGGSRTAGVRFTGVNIPQGATITNAYIQFEADRTESGTTSLTINGENADNAPTFGNTDYDISSRPLTTASVAWSPGSWTLNQAGVNEQTPDISSIIQEVVDSSGWTSGNSLALIISGSASRRGESYDGDPPAAPLLHVVFTTGPPVTVPNVVGLTKANATTAITGAGLVLGTVTTQASTTVPAGDVISQNPASGTSVASGSAVSIVVSTGSSSGPETLDIRVSASSDDAVERVSGGYMYLTSSYLFLTYNGSRTAGMRFTGLNIPQGATITNAYIQFEADRTESGTTSLTINGENADNASTFGSTTSDITSRPLTTASVAWSPGSWTNGQAGVNEQTPDISSIVQEIVDSSGWTSGNSVAIIISGSASRRGESYDGDPPAAPLLHIDFTSSVSSQVTVPNVVGLTQANATTVITGAGLVLGTVTNQTSSTVPSGDVISQNPVSGTSAITGSAVNIVVSTGSSSQVTVPNVVGLTQANATTAITGAGLVLGTVTTQTSATVPSGDVISQNPVSGTSVAASSAVDIVVSSGPALVASGGGPHAVKVAGTYIYGYDANGNMTSGSGRVITYDFENRPTSIIKGGVTSTFVYDGDGGRVQKTDSTGTTIYIGALYVCDNGSCSKMIFAGGKRVAMKEVSGGAVSYYHPDHLGSTSVVTDSSGNSEQDLSYYPYGDTFLNVGTKDVRFKYTGKERDNDTGLYFYEARYYDPFLGRFISADTIVPDPLDPQAFNRYSYAGNNPIIYSDPTGHFGFFAAFAIGFAIGATTTAIQGGSIGDIFTSAVISGFAAGAGNFSGNYVQQAFFNQLGQNLSAFAGANGILSDAQLATGSIIGGIAGGATAGLTATVGFRAAGFDVNIGNAVGLGALSGGLTGGIGPQGLTRNLITQKYFFAIDIIAHGLVGGGISELAGGQFVEGFAFAATLSSLDHAFRAVAKTGGAKFGPSGENVFGNKEGTICVEGDLCSIILRLIPGFDAASKFHDPFFDTLKKNIPEILVKWPSMVPSLAVGLGSATQGLFSENAYAPAVLLSTIQKNREEEDNN